MKIKELEKMYGSDMEIPFFMTKIELNAVYEFLKQEGIIIDKNRGNKFIEETFSFYLKLAIWQAVTEYLKTWHLKTIDSN